MKRSTTRSIRVLTVLSLGAVVLGGCSSAGTDQAGADGKYRQRPEPALQTLADRRVDNLNSGSVARSTNFRMMWEDLGRALHLNRPSRLTPKQVAY